MKIDKQLSEKIAGRLNPNVNAVSDSQKDLLSDKVAERVYKNTKDSKINV